MADQNLRMVYNSAKDLLIQMEAHYNAILYNIDLDPYYVGMMVQKLKNLISEANNEIDSRHLAYFGSS